MSTAEIALLSTIKMSVLLSYPLYYYHIFCTIIIISILSTYFLYYYHNVYNIMLHVPLSCLYYHRIVCTIIVLPVLLPYFLYYYVIFDESRQLSIFETQSDCVVLKTVPYYSKRFAFRSVVSAIYI